MDPIDAAKVRGEAGRAKSNGTELPFLRDEWGKRVYKKREQLALVRLKVVFYRTLVLKLSDEKGYLCKKYTRMTAPLASQDTTTDTFKVKFLQGKPLHLYANGMSRAEFYAFCLVNSELRIERTADDHLIITRPTGSETGNWNSEMNTEINLWNRRTKLGLTFDSAAGFTLPNGAVRAPDSAWIHRDRWEAVPAEEQKKFAGIVPDFVLELRSEGQSLSELREKSAPLDFTIFLSMHNH